VREKGIKPKQIVGELYDPKKVTKPKTDFQEFQDLQTVMIHAQVSKNIYDIVCKVSSHCPRLWSMLMKGTKEGKHNERLYRPYETKIYVDVVLRFWRYADFELDFMLAQ